MDMLNQVDKDLLEIQATLESIDVDFKALMGELPSVGIESFSSASKGILETIWKFIQRVAAAIGRIFGLVGSTSVTLRASIAAAERSLALYKGKQPRSGTVTLSHEVNQLLVANKVLNGPSEYTVAYKKLDDAINAVLKYHLPAVRSVSKSLGNIYNSKYTDNLTFLNDVVAAAQSVGIDKFVSVTRCRLVTNDKRFARTRPIYKGPDLIGNRSIFVDVPYLTVSGYASDYDRARQTADTRISYIYSYGNVDRVGGEVDVRAGSYIDVKDMLGQLTNILNSIDKYPIDSLEKDIKTLEGAFSSLSSTMSREEHTRNDERYLTVAGSILATFSTWVSNPHTQLITNSLAVTRASVIMINRHLRNLA